MTLSRRAFLKGVIVLGLSPVIAWPARQVVEAARYDFAGKATPDTFVPLVGSSFQVYTESGHTSIDLVHIDPVKADRYHESFSILFRGSSPLVEAGTYLFHHDQLGSHYIYLTPIGRPAENNFYEAIFSRRYYS